MAERSTSVRLRAEVDQYIRDMGRAGQVTAGLGKAGERAAEQLVRAQKRQVNAAMDVRIAEERLKEVRTQGNATASQILSAEQSLVRAKEFSTEATQAATRAEAAHVVATQQSSTAMGRLAASARENRDAWTQASVPLLAVGTGVTAMGAAALRTGIQYNTLQQTTRAALTTLTGSAAEASAQMDKLDEFARTSPFAKQTFIQAQQQLLGFGMEASKILPTLDAIQNAVAAFGGSNQQISEIAFIMAQIQAAGKITATDLMQLGQRGVDAATLIGSQMGMTGAQIRESITAGSLSAGDALDALTAGMDQRFGGAAENVKNTFAGAMDRVMAAWRDLSSELAAPLVGPDGGGLFTGLLNETADVMREFEAMPSAAKYAVGGLTGLVGAASLLGGGFLLLTPRIVETREALEKMRKSGPGAAAALDRAGVAARAFGVAMAGLVAYQSLDALIPDVAIANLEEFESALLDLADTSIIGADSLDKLFQHQGSWQSWASMDLNGRVQELHGLADAFEVLGNAQWGDRAISKLSILDDEISLATRSFEATDEALARMVSSGNAEDAATAFTRIRSEAESAGYPLKDLTGLFPAYQEALKGAENEQRTSADAMADLTEAIKQQRDAWRDAATAALDARGSSIAVTEAQLAATAAVADGARVARDAAGDVDASAEATIKADKALINLASASLRNIEAMEKNGASVIDLNGKLASQRDAFVNTAESMGYTRAEARALADEYGLIPESVDTKVRANIDAAQVALRQIKASLDAIPLVRNIRIHTTATRSGDDSPGRSAVGRRTDNADGGLYVGPVKARAAGGFDEYGRGVPRVPQLRNGNQGTVMWGEPETGWEAYISGKPGMEARNRGILADAAERLGMAVMPLDLGQITAFADGGRLDRLNAQRRVRDLQRDLRETEVVGKGRNRRRRRVLRGLDAQIAREELREARAELADLRRPASRRRAAREQRREDISRGTSDYLGNADLSEGALRSPAAVERALQQSIADMATFTMLLIELKKKGASPWLLGQLQGFGPGKGTIRLARQYLADNAKLRSTNALAAQAQEVSRVYGTVTTDQRWDASRAWNPAMTNHQQQVINRTVNVNVTTDDPSRMATEIRRLTRHELEVMAAGAVI